MTGLALAVAVLLAAAVVIYLASEFFVNGVEWVGHRLGVGQKATGAVLAAFGTALPECVVTFAAVVFGRTPAARDIGVGAALGGPLALATLAYAVVGATLFFTRRPLAANAADRAAFGGLCRDQVWFLVIFLVKLALGLLVFAWKPWLALGFLAAYAAYVWSETRGGGVAEAPDLEPLRLAPKSPRAVAGPGRRPDPRGPGGDLFRVPPVRLAHGGSWPVLGLRPQLLALLISPIATELPETLNAVIWIRQGKTRLALANISGAMMIQATIPTALGLAFTPWRLDATSLAGGAVTAVAIAALAVAFATRRISRAFLAAMALGYGIFVVLLLAP